MKNKSGRPPKPKGTAKKIVLSVKLSDKDFQSIELLRRASGQSKSDFFRCLAMGSAEQQKVKLLFASIICDDLKKDALPVELEATLTADGQPPSVGKLSVDSALGEPGHYYPIEPSNLNKYPLQGTTLKLTGRTERLSVKNLQLCAASSRSAYHIWFDKVEY